MANTAHNAAEDNHLRKQCGATWERRFYGLAFCSPVLLLSDSDLLPIFFLVSYQEKLGLCVTRLLSVPRPWCREVGAG